MCPIACYTTHVKSVILLFPNTLQHILRNTLQCGSDFLSSFTLIGKGGHKPSFSYNPREKNRNGSGQVNCLYFKTTIVICRFLKSHLKSKHILLLLLLLFTRPLLRDGGMAEDHGVPEAGQLSRVWTTARKEIESPKSERRRVRSRTVQNEMRGVLGRVCTGAA